MAVSVVIPTYCAERFLTETLESVFAQTRRPDEIVIVDDDSTDRTANLVQEIATKSPAPIRFEVLAKNSGGPSAPTNRGVELAQGDVIVLLDHDDVMLPEKLARQVAVLEAHPGIDFVLGDYEHFGPEGLLQNSDARHWEPEGHAALLRDNAQELQIIDSLTALKAFVKRPGLALSCSSYCFRRSLWNRVGGFDHRYMPVADYDFLLRALDQPIAWIDRILFRKRVHDSNHWRTFVADPSRKWRSEWSVARAQRAHLRRCPYADAELRQLVASHTGYVASGFLGTHQLGAALTESYELLSLGDLENAFRMFARLAAVGVGWGRK